VEELIEIRGLSFRYKGSDEWALRDIDLRLAKGEYVLVCGASGSGKSTLALVLSGLIPHFVEGDFSGHVAYLGEDTRSMSIADFLARVGLVFQNPDAQLFNTTVFSEMAFGLDSLAVPPEEMERRILDTARDLGISNLLDRRPEELSGGEKRLAALASILCLDPEVLVLDEPFSNLDTEGSHRLRAILESLRNAGRTLMVVEQRIGRAFDSSNRCILMEEGRIIFDGIPSEAAELIKKKGLLPSYPTGARRAAGGAEVVSVRGLECSRGGREILKGVSLSIRKGEILAVIGKNGAGKTTLVRHLNGLAHPNGGEVLIEGSPLHRRNSFKLGKAVGVSFQNPNDQFFKSTVRDEILAGATDKGESLERLSEVFEITPILNRSPYLLSEGQKKRVALASVMALNPKVLVLDEPTIGQDGRFLTELASLLLRLRESGIGIVVVTHDLLFAEAVCDRWIWVEGGLIKEEGTGPVPRQGGSPNAAA
jgi:energy-coupling factor transport system ATP-binding protein